MKNLLGSKPLSAFGLILSNLTWKTWAQAIQVDDGMVVADVNNSYLILVMALPN